MPELPEVECVRRSLWPRVRNRRVVSVDIRRAKVIHGVRSRSALLAGKTIRQLVRHGKQLAILTTDGPALCIHLGMTGSLRYIPPGDSIPRSQPHVHLVWRFHDGAQLVFADPRRFGGVWTFEDFRTLRDSRWRRLGPDALQQWSSPDWLYRRLQASRRSIKSALLDQSLVAGLGNIYVCELLFLCKLHPLLSCSRLTLHDCGCLTRGIKAILRRAIRMGGSSISDYRDGLGSYGGFQHFHRVYNREGQPCAACGQLILRITQQGRSSWCCPNCQRLGTKNK